MARKKYLGINADYSGNLVRLGVDIPAGLKLEFDIATRKSGTNMTAVVAYLVQEWLKGNIYIPFLDKSKK